MRDMRVYSPNYISELERLCILFIEKELDMFFSSCIKSALAYSYMVSNNLALHEKKNFQEKVISNQQINVLVENILSKINIEIIKNMEYLPLDLESIESSKINYHNNFLSETISNLRITQVTTGICEYIIDSAFSRTLNGVCQSRIINYLLKKNISSKKILDKNSLANQKRKHQELIYKQTEGFLINMKISLRNELIKACIININSIEDTYAESSIA